MLMFMLISPTTSRIRQLPLGLITNYLHRKISITFTFFEVGKLLRRSSKLMRVRVCRKPWFIMCGKWESGPVTLSLKSVAISSLIANQATCWGAALFTFNQNFKIGCDKRKRKKITQQISYFHALKVHNNNFVYKHEKRNKSVTLFSIKYIQLNTKLYDIAYDRIKLVTVGIQDSRTSACYP